MERYFYSPHCFAPYASLIYVHRADFIERGYLAFLAALGAIERHLPGHGEEEERAGLITRRWHSQYFSGRLFFTVGHQC